MSTKSDALKEQLTENFSEFSQLSDYSFMNSLNADPESKPIVEASGHIYAGTKITRWIS